MPTASHWATTSSGLVSLMLFLTLPDFSQIIYAVSNYHSVIRTWSCVRGVCACRKACRLARISCHVGQVPKWRLKGTGKLSGFLYCVEVSHNLGLLYRCAVQGRPHWLTSPESHLKSMFWILPPTHFVHLFSSVSLALYGINKFFTLTWSIYAGLVHLYLNFLHKVTISKYLLHWDFM